MNLGIVDAGPPTSARMQLDRFPIYIAESRGPDVTCARPSHPRAVLPPLGFPPPNNATGCCDQTVPAAPPLTDTSLPDLDRPVLPQQPDVSSSTAEVKNISFTRFHCHSLFPTQFLDTAKLRNAPDIQLTPDLFLESKILQAIFIVLSAPLSNAKTFIRTTNKVEQKVFNAYTPNYCMLP
ncbi:hypothetical protein J6590_018768 [Homalodisca vitripennis]|nr:hypothetical protein J6590_018768 [Homalodisca vitripennis]